MPTGTTFSVLAMMRDMYYFGRCGIQNDHDMISPARLLILATSMDDVFFPKPKGLNVWVCFGRFEAASRPADQNRPKK
jgi:hypothetical protein